MYEVRTESDPGRKRRSRPAADSTPPPAVSHRFRTRRSRCRPPGGRLAAGGGGRSRHGVTKIPGVGRPRPAGTAAVRVPQPRRYRVIDRRCRSCRLGQGPTGRPRHRSHVRLPGKRRQRRDQPPGRHQTWKCTVVVCGDMACTACPAPSATRRLRNNVQKTIGKPCAGKPHARIERGMWKRVCTADTAPLTTNGQSILVAYRRQMTPRHKDGVTSRNSDGNE